MFGTIELVSESTELMFESFEHRFIHKKQNKFCGLTILVDHSKPY